MGAPCQDADMSDLLWRQARLVPFRSRHELARLRSRPTAPAPRAAAVGRPVDLRVRQGVVTEIGADLVPAGEEVLDAGGAFLLPGLWDAHAHLDMEAARSARLDTSGTHGPEEVLGLVARAVRHLDPARPPLVEGFGHRLSQWARVPTVAELDEVTGQVPTVLISGDVHSGWLNSAALRVLGLAGATAEDPGGPVREEPWFALIDRLHEVPGSLELRESGYAGLLRAMVAKGVTGVVDMSWSESPTDWRDRVERLRAAGAPVGLIPRIRAAVYGDRLEQWIAAGLRQGDPLPGAPAAGDGSPLITQGPLKVIADGSLGTGSAHLCEPYPEGLDVPGPHGVANISRTELTELLARAHGAGYQAAVHAIGDAAMTDVAAAFAASGARGRVEHAQLLPQRAAGADCALASLVDDGIELSVQPAHLLDDWQTVGRLWPGREARTYAFADMMAAGALLQLGSDAPVAALDPWLAMSAAVDRRTPGGQVWSPSQRLTPEEALAASTDGAGPLGVASTADMVLVESDPRELIGDELASVRPLATVVAGRLVFSR